MDQRSVSNIQHIQTIATLLRYWIITATTQAGSGHVSSSLSAVEVMAALMAGGFFRFDVSDPSYHNNDRLIFSKGHASPLFYALWALAGGIPVEELRTLRQFGSRLEGHPTMAFPFTEVPTGSLGQGLSVGVGMALNAMHIDKLPYHTWVLLGDSEMAEGSNWEAIEIAAHYGLSQLVGIVDVNRLGQRGETLHGHDTHKIAEQVESFGWETREIDGHDIQQAMDAYSYATTKRTKPLMILAKTRKGKGVSLIEDKDGWHGKSLSHGEATHAIDALGSIDADARITLPPPERIRPAAYVPVPKTTLVEDYDDPLAPRKAYGHALVKLHRTYPQMVVLDAEMSNSTFSETFKKTFPDRFFEMYIAEQNMVGVAAGLAARGKMPWISTFGAFFTRAYDQLRMSAYASLPIHCVGSHVGVSLGQDGASQMGIEDISLFRSLHNSVVVAPADHISVEKLAAALVKHQGMTYMRVGRNDVDPLYDEETEFRIGGSHVHHATEKDQITLISNGPTLYEALQAHDMLKADVQVRVIDAYSIQPIDVETLIQASLQTRALVVIEDHRDVGGLTDAVRSALAGRPVRIFSCAVSRLPVSGTSAELYDHMGISAKKIVEKVHEIVRSL